MIVQDVLSYVVLFKDQWERVRDAARHDHRLFLYPEENVDRNLVFSRETDEIVADLGSNPDDEYYWMTFFVLGEGCDLLRKAISIDDDLNVH